MFLLGPCPRLFKTLMKKNNSVSIPPRYAYPLMLWLALFLAPFVLRGLLLLKSGMALSFFDLRGVFSDALISLLLTLFIHGFLLRLFPRVVSLALIEFWCLLCYGNYEHIRALGANASAFYAGYLLDETFREGSAFAVSSPILLIFLLVLSGVWGWFILRSIKAAAPSGFNFHLAGIGLSVLSSFILLFVWTGHSSIIGWRQNNFLWDNIVWSVLKRPKTEKKEPPAPAKEPLPEHKRIRLGHRKSNVLLIMLEGVSGAHIRPIAEANGHKTGSSGPDPNLFGRQEEVPKTWYSLPNLNLLADQGMTYTNFIVQQRQTNRGEYALLCGEYPALGTRQAKMTEYAYKGGKVCLPQVLAEAGYATAYLQAAPLAFMMKDQFMQKIGFEQVVGARSFDRAYSRNRWGVDDLAFFEQSYDRIMELNRGEKPWFATLLTVGTHHPFNIPDDPSFPLPALRIPFSRAVEYADMSVGKFLEQLEAAGILENTLVLITSDESSGLKYVEDAHVERLSYNWGFMIALMPQQTTRFIDDLAMQMDIPASILDYIGLEDRIAEFSGRSLFRKYPKLRSGAFANTILRSVGGVDPEGNLYLCLEDFSGCEKFEMEGQKIFSAKVSAVDRFDGQETEFLRDIVEQSLASTDDLLGQDITLTTIDVIPLESDMNIFGGQNIDIPAGTQMEVTLDIEAMGEEGQVTLKHALRGSERWEKWQEGLIIYRETFLLLPGDRYRLRYTYTTDAALALVRNSLRVKDENYKSGLTLKIRDAKMKLRPAGFISRMKAPLLQVPEMEWIYAKETSAETHNSVGLFLLSQKRAGEAVTRFTAALKERPEYFEARENIGIASMKDKKPQEAVKHFLKALKLRPDNAMIYHKLGSAYGLSGNKRKALESYSRSYEILVQQHGEKHPYSRNAKKFVEEAAFNMQPIIYAE